MTVSGRKALFDRINKQRSLLLTLGVMYAVFCVFRYLMALYSSSYPIVMIDEILYYSMARSMGAHGQVTFMGQPANYNSVFYSFLMSPVYWLPEGTNYYRLIQLINILVFNLSLFPIFFLARRVCSSTKRALVITFISMLAPDFILGQLIMSEGVIYPMFFLSFCLFYRFLQEKSVRDMLWFGLLTAAIFCTKPGVVAGSAAAIVFLLLYGLIRRDRVCIRASLIAAGAAAGASALFYLLISVAFDHHVGQYFGLYQSQITLSEKSKNLSALFSSAWMYPCCFILACAGGIFITPVLRIRDMSGRDRLMMLIMLSSVLFLLIGTAWTVNRVENDLSVHMRYTAQFIPLFLIFTFAGDAPEEEIKKRRLRKRPPAANDFPPSSSDAEEPLSASAAAEETDAPDSAESDGISCPPVCDTPLTDSEAVIPDEEKRSRPSALLLIPLYMLTAIAFFDIPRHIRNSSNVVFELSLSWLNTSVFGTKALAVLFAVAVLIFTAVLIMGRFSTRARQWASAGAAFCVFICGEFTYGTLRSYVQPIMTQSTDQLSRVIGDDEYLYVYSTWVYYNSALDVRSRDETSMCYVNDLYNNTLRTKGVYAPFVPTTQRGAVPRNETPDTDLIVMDTNAFHQVQLSEYAEVISDTSLLKAVRFTKGKRWLDSMMGGIVDGNVLRKGTTLNIVLFNEQLSNGKSKLKFDIDVDAETELILTMDTASSGKKSYSFTIPDYRDTYTLDIPKGTTWITMVLKDSSAHLYKFETVVGK